MRAVCVGRHPFLSEHIASFFARFGLRTEPAVGLDDALEAVRRFEPDLVVCEYDLLATLPLERWERDETFSRVPVVAVSLTRRSHELHPLDVNAIAGFLYLPKLCEEDALAVLRAVCGRARQVLPSTFGLQRPAVANGTR